jgi:hypothetical protein
MQAKKKQKKTPLADVIVGRIEGEKIAPTPKWRFLAMNQIFWGLWAASIFIGAAAVAAAIFVMVNAGWEYYEMTHSTFLTFFVEAIPILWILFLLLFVIAAYENARHTKYGYRYSITLILSLSIIGSGIGGGVLYATGLGELFDDTIGDSIPFHRPIVEHQKKLWYEPAEGRLAGEVEEFNPEFTTFTLTTFEGGQWTINTIDLQENDRTTLSTFTQIRIIGFEEEENEEADFHACFIFPWSFHGRPGHDPLRAGSIEFPLFEIMEGKCEGPDELCERNEDDPRSTRCKDISRERRI